MQEINLQREIECLIARIIDSLNRKLETEKDFGAIQKGCKWMIGLMGLFPEMRDYEGFLTSLKEINEQEPSKEIAELVFYTLTRFFNTIFTAHINRPAQGK